MSDEVKAAGNSRENMVTRRKLMRAAGLAGGAALLPHRWVKPVIDSIVVPLHAQSSGCDTQLEVTGRVNWNLDNSSNRLVIQIDVGLGDTASGDAIVDQLNGFSGGLSQSGGTCPQGGALTQIGVFQGDMIPQTGGVGGFFALEVACGGTLFCTVTGEFTGIAILDESDVPLTLFNVTQNCCDPTPLG